MVLYNYKLGEGEIYLKYIAHIRETDKKIQTVAEHLYGVKNLAEKYGAKLRLKHVAGLAGLLHDLGKYSDTFQEYIHQVVFHPEDTEWKRGDVDHSTAGGKLLFDLYHTPKNNPYEKLLAEIVGNAIISHHSNLHDYITPSIHSSFLRRVRDKKIEEYNQVVERFFEDVMPKNEFEEYVSKAVAELKDFMNLSPAQNFFLSKFIFSCLIDADRTDTRLFAEHAEEPQEISHLELFSAYYKKLQNKLVAFKQNSKGNNKINQLRNQMSDQCDSFAMKPSGIYTLSIPTGGGKTLSSLRYSLKHALTYNKQRIIYVVPFTTIIEQNAEEVREILEDDVNVLEHHSNVIEEEGHDEHSEGIITKKERLKLARDNWDSPIIFTTMVQFLNVFYAKGNRNTRRLHNLAHSVIIFDEVQKVPIKCVSLFNEALNFLKQDANCSILLCTATQPTLEQVDHSLLKNRDGEIVKKLPEISKAFKRVEIIDKTTEPMNNGQLADWVQADIERMENALIILNTKSVVKELYESLKNGPVPVYHLSTSMCAAHRKETLDEIRKLLEKDIPFICVTTQLIEAGVDVSFKCVIRSLAGLDSIAQAAGRCNRHGEEAMQNVYVINHQDENLTRLNEIKIGKEITNNLLVEYERQPERYGGDLLSNRTMSLYFQQFYKKMEVDLNYFIPELELEMTKLVMATRKETNYVQAYEKKYKEELPLYLTGSYQTAAEHFRVIDQSTTGVIVPYGEGKEVVATLNSAEHIEDLTKLLRNAQQYTVNLFPHEFEELNKQNALVSHMDGLFFELKESWYSTEYGVDLKGETLLEFVSF